MLEIDLRNCFLDDMPLSLLTKKICKQTITDCVKWNLMNKLRRWITKKASTISFLKI